MKTYLRLLKVTINAFGFPFFSSPKGYFTPEVVTRLNLKNAWGSGETVWDREDGEWTPGIESAIFQSWNGSMTARGGILSDGWSAQSVNHYKDRVDDYVPSDVFDNIIDLSGEWSPLERSKTLWFSSVFHRF